MLIEYGIEAIRLFNGYGYSREDKERDFFAYFVQPDRIRLQTRTPAIS
jgi:hypothetical protein